MEIMTAATMTPEMIAYLTAERICGYCAGGAHIFVGVPICLNCASEEYEFARERFEAETAAWEREWENNPVTRMAAEMAEPLPYEEWEWEPRRKWSNAGAFEYTTPRRVKVA